MITYAQKKRPHPFRGAVFGSTDFFSLEKNQCIAPHPGLTWLIIATVIRLIMEAM